MLSQVFTVGSTVVCAHGGKLMPTEPSHRVLIEGKPVVTAGGLWVSQGCPGEPTRAPAQTGMSVNVMLPSCVTAAFLAGSPRVLASGRPLVRQDSSGSTLPGGQPVLCLSAGQIRVRAS